MPNQSYGSIHYVSSRTRQMTGTEKQLRWPRSTSMQCITSRLLKLSTVRGLFLDRQTSVARPCKVQIPSSDKSGSRIFHITDPTLWENLVDKAPLIRRAWVVQERLLAKRMLHFCQYQLFWECQEKSACEAYPIQLPRDALVTATFKDFRSGDRRFRLCS